jgi:hypothetical protein
MKAPTFIACYDNGGETLDRYTVVFTRALKSVQRKKYYMYLGMSEDPYKGVGLHGDSLKRIDWPNGNHLGKKIKFEELPPLCQLLVMEDYKELHPKSAFA